MENLINKSIYMDKKLVKKILSRLKSPQEFFDFHRFSKPKKFQDLQERVIYNCTYFYPNYVLVILLLSIYALLTNIILLFVTVFVGFGLYFINKLNGKDLRLSMCRLTTAQLYMGLIIISVPLGFLSSPLSTMMWLMGSSGLIIGAHSALMEKPIETVFEDEV